MNVSYVTTQNTWMSPILPRKTQGLSYITAQDTVKTLLYYHTCHREDPPTLPHMTHSGFSSCNTGHFAECRATLTSQLAEPQEFQPGVIWSSTGQARGDKHLSTSSPGSWWEVAHCWQVYSLPRGHLWETSMLENTKKNIVLNVNLWVWSCYFCVVSVEFWVWSSEFVVGSVKLWLWFGEYEVVSVWWWVCNCECGIVNVA